MPNELEVKLAVTSHDPIRARLIELGAVSHGLTHETNTFFDTPDKRLFSSDQGLRIRRNRKPDGETLIVTYKGPKIPGPFKNREEIEVQVDDHDTLVTLFARLGYVVTLSFEKRRETFTLPAYPQTEILLDTLPPHLSPTLPHTTFIEVEAPDEQTVRDLLTLLNLSHLPSEKRSYAQMIDAYLKGSSSAGERVVKFGA